MIKAHTDGRQLGFLGQPGVNVLQVNVGLGLTAPNCEANVDTMVKATQNRGTLEVYLGCAPGVGKTYEMLAQAHALIAEGVDVVAAVVESHGRVHTAAMTADLEIVPRRPGRSRRHDS